MTEQSLLPSAGEASGNHAPPKPARQSPYPWLYGLGFVILAAAIYYTWQNPRKPDDTAAVASAIHTIEQHLPETDARLTRLEQHLSDTDGRLARLEQRPTQDVGKITSRLDALESRLADQVQFASRLDTVSGRIESLAARDQTGFDATKQRIDTLDDATKRRIDALTDLTKQRIDGLTDSTKQRIDGLTTRVSGAETNTEALEAINKRLTRLARLQEASLSLASGRPIGDVPGAPEAIARYARIAPPTEARLRLSFPSAEQAALAAPSPEVSAAPFVDRVWDRAQGLVTVRKGDDVVVGNTSATIIGHAQLALEAGDLAGAVQALETLKGPAGQAMAGWLAEAKALLNARSALTAMAGQA